MPGARRLRCGASPNHACRDVSTSECPTRMICRAHGSPAIAVIVASTSSTLACLVAFWRNSALHSRPARSKACTFSSCVIPPEKRSGPTPRFSTMRKCSLFSHGRQVLEKTGVAERAARIDRHQRSTPGALQEDHHRFRLRVLGDVGIDSAPLGSDRIPSPMAGLRGGRGAQRTAVVRSPAGAAVNAVAASARTVRRIEAGQRGSYRQSRATRNEARPATGQTRAAASAGRSVAMSPARTRTAAVSRKMAGATPCTP